MLSEYEMWNPQFSDSVLSAVEVIEGELDM